MAVDAKTNTNGPQSEPVGTHSHRGLRWAAGTNVALAILLAVAMVAVLQWGGYRHDAKADLTSSKINSLSEGTEKLLDSLDTEVTITSMYFEADLEAPSQAQFREATGDLIDLYRMSNASKIVVRNINPLHDHQKVKEFFKQLRDFPKFKEQIDQYQARIDAFKDTVMPQLAKRLTEEKASLAGLTGSLGQEGGDAQLVQAIDMFLSDCQDMLASVQETVEAAPQGDVPDYAGATSALRTLYGKLQSAGESIAQFAQTQAARQTGVSQDVLDHANQLAENYKPIAELIREEEGKVSDLPQLEFDKIVRQYSDTGNCIFVSTGKDARVIPFSDTWPASGQAAGGGDDEFASREFRGEEKISSATLQLTQEKKPAVVFVRYGGPPLFFGGYHPSAPRAPLGQLRAYLEDLNFAVEEWDLAASATPPEIEPKPERVAYVVLRPSPVPRPRPGQPPQMPPFGEEHRKALLAALGDNGRAMFIAGWAPTEFGLFPAPYEYESYLKDAWGIDVQNDILLLQAVPVGPTEFRFARGPWNMMKTSMSDHIMVKGLGTRRSSFPWVAPLSISENLPEGVQCEPLVICPKSDGLWGVHSVQAYEEQFKKQQHLTRERGDLLGPFTIAVAGTKGDAKIVVVGSRSFAEDSVAFATVPVLTGRGIGMMSLSPSNVTLVVNTLHWLHDNTQWMNLGRPIESRVIEIEEGPTLTFVRALVYGVWPATALVLGSVVWFIRRR